MADETPSGTINVFVPGIKLIPQKTSNICWYAAALMMYNWKKARGGQVPHPDDDSVNLNRMKSNCVLLWGDLLTFAQSVGMVPRPPISPTPEMFAGWLNQGPLWTDGVFVDGNGKTAPSGHMTVVAGIRSVASSDGYEVFIYDPDPVGIGSARWRPISHLTSIMTAASQPIQCSHLYYP